MITFAGRAMRGLVGQERLVGYLRRRWRRRPIDCQTARGTAAPISGPSRFQLRCWGRRTGRRQFGACLRHSATPGTQRAAPWHAPGLPGGHGQRQRQRSRERSQRCLDLPRRVIRWMPRSGSRNCWTPANSRPRPASPRTRRCKTQPAMSRRRPTARPGGPGRPGSGWPGPRRSSRCSTTATRRSTPGSPTARSTRPTTAWTGTWRPATATGSPSTGTASRVSSGR